MTDSQKAVTLAEAEVRCQRNLLKVLYYSLTLALRAALWAFNAQALLSGLRRNDDQMVSATFCEIIKDNIKMIPSIIGNLII